MAREAHLLPAVAALYQAAADPAGWSTAIDRVRQLLGGVGGVVFVMNSTQSQVQAWHSSGLENDDGEYGRRLHAINPRARVSMADAPGTLCWDGRFISDREMDRHEFYDGIQTLSEVRYFIGTRYELDNGLALFTSVERTRKQGHVEERDIALFGLIAPHIRNAMELSSRLADQHRRASLFGLLESDPHEGLVLISPRGRLVEANSEARRILGAKDGLALEEDRLRTWKAADDRTLQSLVAEAVESGAGAGVGPGGLIVLSRPSGALPYLLRVAPWTLAPDDRGEAVAAAVWIADPEVQGRAGQADLCAAFGFSAREAELAAGLSEGRNLAEVADDMAISRNTARVHLAHIFAKTGVSTQGDLLRLLRSIP